MRYAPRTGPSEFGGLSRRVATLEREKGSVSSGGAGLAAQIEALPGLDAFWKLNEPAGTTGAAVVADSYDSHPLSAQNITFGAAAGPPGETTAEFTTYTSLMPLTTAWTALTDNFTAFGWVRPANATRYHGLCGTGSSTSLHGGTSLWELCVADTAPTLVLHINGTTVTGAIPFPTASWAMWAVKRAAGTWSMYVDGTVEAAHPTTTPTGSNTSFFLGHDGFNTVAVGPGQLLGRLSYCAVVRTALSDTDVAALAAAAVDPSEAYGKALTADGSGGTSWEYPTIETRLNGA